VNISALQFVQENFADKVAKILSETGQTGANLVLELTESIVMRDFVESARQMKRLKRLGVRIAIDDFGTGYSSLSYLHRLPIDVLKIDRSFMENLNQIGGTGPIVEAVVSVAHTLGLRVVAEGVETVEQLRSVAKSGFDVIQGYYFSRPVEAAIATRFLRSGRWSVERNWRPQLLPNCPSRNRLPTVSNDQTITPASNGDRHREFQETSQNWWRRWELNPRPKLPSTESIHAFPRSFLSRHHR